MSHNPEKNSPGARLGHRINVHRMRGHPIYRWRASYVEVGRYRSKGFKTRQAAEEWKERQESERLSHGTDGRITAAERSAVLETRELLGEVQLTLREAVEIGIDLRRRERQSAKVNDIINALIRAKEQERKSERYLGNLKSRLGRFKMDFGERVVATISRAEVAEWLHGLNLSPESVNTYRREIGVMFSEAVACGYTDSNPVAKIKPVKVIDEPVGILTPDEAFRLISVAGSTILPAVALGLFAGLRTEELKRLKWDAVGLERKTIHVGADIAKNARNRIVPISENLAAILKPLAIASGRIWPTNGRKILEATRRQAGFGMLGSETEAEKLKGVQLKPWPGNALRHSFASYHLAHHQDAGALALILGHQDARIIFKHYREVVTKEDAAAFWRIGWNRNS